MSTPENNTAEQIHRFHFDDCNVRGEIVTLENAFAEATAHQNLHPVAQKLMGEFLAAVSLLAGVLKYKGLLVLQARGDGPLPLIMAEATDDKKIRGIIQEGARDDLDLYADASIQTLIGQGVLSITIDPEQGQRYQGIAALEGETLADSLSGYFKQSEQLPTKLWIEANEHRASGMLLQALPASAEASIEGESWNRAYLPAQTVKRDELLTLDHETLLYRLFNELETRIQEPEPVKFQCSCSHERSLNALNALSKQEAYDLVEERGGSIDIDCQFCGKHYAFDKAAIQELFKGPDEIH